MSSTVELILGPPCTGKATWVLEAYREALRSAPAPGRGGGDPSEKGSGFLGGRCLMLVPNALRREATLRRLLQRCEAGVLVRPQVLTLPDLAERLLVAAGRPVRRIGPLGRRRLIRACLEDLSDREAAPLGRVREALGLVEALDALFRELKAARIEPDAFARALTGGLATPRNRLLARLYDRYQRYLQRLDLYDDQGRLWHAAALLTEPLEAPGALPGRLDLLVVDGFQQFAPAQLDVVAALADRSRRTLITLVWDPDRPELFAPVADTLERLRGRFRGRLREVRPDGPSGLPPDLERVRTRLFAPPAWGGEAAEGSEASPSTAPFAAPPPLRAEHITVVEAAGRIREVEEVARRIVDLLDGGATAPASIGVIARALADYAPLVRLVFPRYGIRFRVAGGLPLSEVPVVRAAMALVRLEAEDYAFRALARVLGSAYFRPEAFGGAAETARAALRLAREAGVWTGREAYFRGLKVLKARTKAEAEAVDDSGEPLRDPARMAQRLAEIEAAEAFLVALFDGLALPREGTGPALAEALRALVRRAGLWEAAREAEDPRHRARDLQALAALETVLEEAALAAGRPDADEAGEADAQAIPLSRFLDDVARGLAEATVPLGEPTDAPVLVLDAHQARAIEFDHVLLVGLAEKAFPSRGRARPFFGEAQRRDLRRRGLDLADAGRQAQDEMLLFYLAATRARRSLVLSFSSLDDSGRPQLPSHFVDDLVGLFPAAGGGPALEWVQVPVCDLALRPEATRCRRHLLATTMFALWGPGENPDIDRDLGTLVLLARGGTEDVAAALGGLAVERQRERGEGFGRFDGVIEAPDLLADLCEAFPGTEAMSPRRLERFGRCPFAFLAGDLLGLERREEPSPYLAPLDLGLICHELLHRLFDRVRRDRTLKGRVSGETLDKAQALLEETARAYFEELERSGRVGSPALWRIQREAVLRDLRGLLAWHAENLAAWRVERTEWRAGPGGPDATRAAPYPRPHRPPRPHRRRPAPVPRRGLQVGGLGPSAGRPGGGHEFPVAPLPHGRCAGLRPARRRGRGRGLLSARPPTGKDGPPGPFGHQGRKRGQGEPRRANGSCLHLPVPRGHPPGPVPRVSADGVPATLRVLGDMPIRSVAEPAQVGASADSRTGAVRAEGASP